MKIYRPKEEMTEEKPRRLKATFPNAPKPADGAEELSEIENVVQRAFFLTRCDSMKKAA
jgi:hypothetical protein